MPSSRQAVSRHIQLALLLPLLTVPPVVAAQDSTAAGGGPATSSETVRELRKALEEEKARIRQLEERLLKEEAQSGQSAQSVQPPPSGPQTQSAQSGQPAPSGQAAQVPLATRPIQSDQSASVIPRGAPPATASTAVPVNSSFGPEGFVLKSADGANVLKLRGNVTVDGRYFTDSYTPPTADTWLIRRLRPTMEGTIDGRYDFRLLPDFAQGKSIIQDAWASARVKPWFVITAGKFKVPLGLERLQFEQFARFAEAALPSDLLGYRDIGAKVGGVIGGGLVNYDVGVFDGAVDGGSTDGNTSPDMNSTGKFTTVGRVFFKPFSLFEDNFLQGLGFGVAGSYVNNRGVATSATTTSLLANYKTTGQQPLFSYRGNTQTNGTFNNATIAQGIERRLTPQFYYYLGPIGLLGEYVQTDQQVQRQVSASNIRFATLRNDAWQIQGAFFLTGEDEGYDKATPRRNLGHGGFGALELVARYHAIQFDSLAFEGAGNSFANPATAVRGAHAVGVGLNWYFNRNVKTQLNYEITHFQGGAITGNRPDERVLTSQFAVIF